MCETHYTAYDGGDGRAADTVSPTDRASETFVITSRHGFQPSGKPSRLKTSHHLWSEPYCPLIYPLRWLSRHPVRTRRWRRSRKDLKRRWLIVFRNLIVVSKFVRYRRNRVPSADRFFPKSSRKTARININIIYTGCIVNGVDVATILCRFQHEPPVVVFFRRLSY